MEIGRYTPTAIGSDWSPINSIAIVRQTPISTSPHGSLRVRMPSVTSAMIVALGESSLVIGRPSISRMRPPIPGSTR